MWAYTNYDTADGYSMDQNLESPGGISTSYSVCTAMLPSVFTTLTSSEFGIIDWSVLTHTVPAMLAVTFFGLLHVPINVPALGLATGEDNVSLDRELIAHGLSNLLSGFMGSIQNYLVYTNSVVFIRGGGNSRLAGLMLAAATFGIMTVGPATIGFIPVTMVGTLIFILGFELSLEALWADRKRLTWREYLTVSSL